MYHVKPSRNPSATTHRVQDLVDQGVLRPETVRAACLSHLSESDVADLAECEGFFDYEVAE